MGLHEAKVGDVHRTEFKMTAIKAFQEDQWVQSSHGLSEASSMGPTRETSL